MAHIYAIRDPLTGECLYVGQTKDLRERLWRHKYNLRRGKALKAFQEWFDSSGLRVEQLELITLVECEDSDEVKNFLEIKYFEEMRPKYYGVIPNMRNRWSHSADTKQKISEGLRESDRFHTLEDIQCPNCGVMFRPKLSKTKGCSRECGSALRENVGRPRNPDTREIVNCEMCGVKLLEGELRRCVKHKGLHRNSKYTRPSEVEGLKDMINSGIPIATLYKKYNLIPAALYKWAREHTDYT